MFERYLTVQGFPATLNVQTRPNESIVTLIVQPFASAFHVPKATLTIKGNASDERGGHENALQLSGSEFIGAEAMAFLSAAQAASMQMMQWEGLSRSLSDPSDAAYAITKLAAAGDWDSAMLYIALTPNVLAAISPRANYRSRDKHASNLASALLRSPAFSSAKSAFLRFYSENNAADFADLLPADEARVRTILTLLSRVRMADSGRVALQNLCLLLERDDVSGYLSELEKYTPSFALNTEKSDGGQSPVVCSDASAISPEELFNALYYARLSLS